VISENEFNRAREVLRRSGFAAHLEERLREGVGGAPRRLSVEVLLAACIAVHGPDHASANLVQVHRALTHTLVVSAQYRAGTRWKIGGKSQHVTVRQVRYLFRRICTTLDYSPHTTHGLSPQERDAREDELFAWLTATIRAAIPDEIGLATAMAIDGSSAPTASRPGSPAPSAARQPDYRGNNTAFARQSTGAWDPDARWAHETKTHEKGTSRTFGHSLIAGVGVYDPKSPFRTLHLVQTMTITPNGYNNPAPTLRMIDGYLSEGRQLNELLSDRGFSNWDEKGWANELLRRDIDQVIDVNPADRGPRLDPESGALLIDGWPYLPWVKDELRHIPRPTRLKLIKPNETATPKKKRTYAKLLAELVAFRTAQAELARYALIANTNRRKDGSRQYTVPTYRRERATAAQRKTKMYKQPTIVLGGQVGAKLRQHERWGSDKWIDKYSCRTSIEGFFGVFQSRDCEGVRRGWIRVVGLTAIALMTALAMVQYNLRTMRVWAQKNHYQGDDILLQPDPKTEGYEAVPVDESPHGAIDPPLAA
jgi:hypothetical protein